MGVKERKERERTDTKRVILEAATQLFVEDGFLNTSIRGIAAKSEYSTGTIYLYFKDKTEIVAEIMQQGFQIMLQTLKKVERQADPLLYLKNLGHAYLNFGFNHPEYYNLIFLIDKPEEMNDYDKDWNWKGAGLEDPTKQPQEMDEYDKDSKGFGNASFGLLIDILQECIDKKLIRFVNARNAWLNFWGFLHGMMALHLKKRLRMMKEEDITGAFADAFDEYFDVISIKN